MFVCEARRQRTGKKTREPGLAGHADAQRHTDGTDEHHNHPNQPTQRTSHNPHVSATTEAAADSRAAGPESTAPRVPVKSQTNLTTFKPTSTPARLRDDRNRGVPVKIHRGEPGHTSTRDTRTHGSHKRTSHQPSRPTNARPRRRPQRNQKSTVQKTMMSFTGEWNAKPLAARVFQTSRRAAQGCWIHAARALMMMAIAVTPWRSAERRRGSTPRSGKAML
jgi:hypothetical protein